MPLPTPGPHAAEVDRSGRMEETTAFRLRSAIACRWPAERLRSSMGASLGLNSGLSPFARMLVLKMGCRCCACNKASLKPHILGPDRSALHPSDQNEVTRRPRSTSQSKCSNGPSLRCHLQSLALARCHQGDTHKSSSSRSFKPKH